MSGYGGLIELVLVFSFVLGWGLLELRATKLDSKKARDIAAEKSNTSDEQSNI